VFLGDEKVNDEKIIGVATRSTGFVEKIDTFTDKIPEYDPRSGSHFWIMVTSYKVDPAKALEGELLMDHESLVSVAGPGCYYCESEYTKLIASRRCKGHP
jgi:hypothetical protein